MSSDGNHMTRLGDVKQEIQTWRLAVSLQLMTSNVVLIVNLMMINWKILRRTLQRSVHDIVTESIWKVKDSILKALKEEKYENLEAKLFELKVVSATFLLVRFFKCKREY